MGKHGQSVKYDGVTWIRRRDGYYGNKYRSLLHRYVWEQHHGPIPDGMHIHHKDHDKGNNDISNLALVTPAEHHTHHERDTEWHRKGGYAAWANARYRDYVCERCGEGFRSRGTQDVVRYCSQACRDYASRAREERVCCVCGERYECQTRLPSRTCSRRCTSIYAYQQRRSRVRPDRGA